MKTEWVKFVAEEEKVLRWNTILRLFKYKIGEVQRFVITLELVDLKDIKQGFLRLHRQIHHIWLADGFRISCEIS